MSVLLSTSNSNNKYGKRWMSIWLCAFIFAMAVIVIWDMICEKNNWKINSEPDSPELWAKVRKRASVLGDKAFIIVGDSKAQYAFDLRVMSKYTEAYPVQLAIIGTPSYPVMKNLAEDTDVSGTILVASSLGRILYDHDGDNSNEFLAYYEQMSKSRLSAFYSSLEWQMQRQVETAFPYLQNIVRPDKVLWGILNGEIGKDSQLKMLPDRRVLADYSGYNKKTVKRKVASFPETEPKITADFKKGVRELQMIVKKIQRNGGRVILLRLPSSGAVWEAEQREKPREIFWKYLEDNTSAECIHFADYSSLAEYNLPDGSHMDYRDASGFTRDVCQIIFDRKTKK